MEEIAWDISLSNSEFHLANTGSMALPTPILLSLHCVENVRDLSPRFVLSYSLLPSLSPTLRPPPLWSILMIRSQSPYSSCPVGFSGDYRWQRDGFSTDGLPRLQSSEHFLEFGLRKWDGVHHRREFLSVGRWKHVLVFLGVPPSDCFSVFHLFLLFLIVLSFHSLILNCSNFRFYRTLTILAMGSISNAEDEGRLSVVGCLQFEGRLVLNIAPLTLLSQNYTVGFHLFSFLYHTLSSDLFVHFIYLTSPALLLVSFIGCVLLLSRGRILRHLGGSMSSWLLFSVTQLCHESLATNFHTRVKVLEWRVVIRYLSITLRWSISSFLRYYRILWFRRFVIFNLCSSGKWEADLGGSVDDDGCNVLPPVLSGLKVGGVCIFKPHQFCSAHLLSSIPTDPSDYINCNTTLALGSVMWLLRGQATIPHKIILLRRKSRTTSSSSDLLRPGSIRVTQPTLPQETVLLLLFWTTICRVVGRSWSRISPRSILCRAVLCHGKRVKHVAVKF